MNSFKYNIIFKIILCTFVATALALTTHIYLFEWVKPFLDQMMQSAIARGISSNPDSSQYGKIIIYSAYSTAFITIGIFVFLYYHCQHLMPGVSKFKKMIITMVIIFGIKGDLVRQPIMDLILNYTTGFPDPILFVILNHADKWIANLLLAGCVVYLCPQKNKVII